MNDFNVNTCTEVLLSLNVTFPRLFPADWYTWVISSTEEYWDCWCKGIGSLYSIKPPFWPFFCILTICTMENESLVATAQSSKRPIQSASSADGTPFCFPLCELLTLFSLSADNLGNQLNWATSVALYITPTPGTCIVGGNTLCHLGFYHFLFFSFRFCYLK